MAYYLFAPNGQDTQIAPSLGGGIEPGNPTNIPLSILKQFHFTFLIRHPRRSIPSYYRCTIPPLREITNFTHFMPNEAGYEELVRLFDFLIERGVVDKKHLTVLDADDMLDNPEGTIKAYCDRTGIDYQPGMLVWDDKDEAYAAEHFAKWNGFHDDALHTSGLQQRSKAQVRLIYYIYGMALTDSRQKTSTVDSENKEWREKYGSEAQKVIRATVDANIPHYEYLKQFCLKV